MLTSRTRRNVTIRAEYIWIDGTEPTPLLRSKTKVLQNGDEPPIWGFDGSSTNQAPGSSSDCVLKPVKVVPDPIRGGDDILVLCEVLTVDLEPRTSRTPAPSSGRSPRSTPTTSPGSASSRSTPSSRKVAPSASPSSVTRPRRAATTAASAPTRSSAVRSSRTTSTTASRPASASRASTPR